MDAELFNIKLTAEGGQWLRRLRRPVQYLFSVSLIIFVFTVYVFVRDLLPVIELIGTNALHVETYVGFAYTIIFALIFPFESYFFFRFNRMARKSFEQSDIEAFNKSFRLLYLNAIMMVITYSANLIYLLVIAYFYLNT